jgi:DNA-binding CsgD family transcriptional regulator
MGELLTPEVLGVLSTLLLDLFSACDALPFPEFQHEALRLVQEKLPFDSALWAAGTVAAGREPVIFSIFLYNQPEEMLASYERVKGHDLPIMRALAEPGMTINVAASDVVWAEGSEAMKAHVERYGMQHTLTTVTRGPVTDLLSAITLYRADPANRFSEHERLLQQNLVPHLEALCNRSRIQHLEEAMHPGRERRRRAAALVDGKGMLYNANPGFINLMLAEWPDWRGPMLPPALFDAVVTASATHALFSRIAVHASAVNDLFLLHLRKTAPCDSLSEREWDVASAFGRGLSHKEIARHLGIAPGTVRNHLTTIYEKLGVSNKAELVHSLAMAPR